MALNLNILGFLISSLIFTSSSRDWVISLKPKEIKIENRGFYIQSVEDQRQVTSNFGYIEGLGKYKTYLILDGGTETAIAEYLNKSLPADSSQIPVELVIKKFKATNIQGWSIISAVVEMDLEYIYLNERGDPEKVEMSIIKEKDNLINISKRTYSKVIRDILEASIKQLHDEIETQPLTP